MGETKTGGGARQPLDGGGSHLDQKGRARDEWVRSYPKSGGIQAAHKMMNVSLEEARRVIEGAEEKAVKIGQPSNIAVVDAGANLVAFEHMDGAWLGRQHRHRQNKVFTAMLTLSALTEGEWVQGTVNTENGLIVSYDFN